MHFVLGLSVYLCVRASVRASGRMHFLIGLLPTSSFQYTSVAINVFLELLCTFSATAAGRSMHGSASLQVCYLNDVAADLDRDPSTASAVRSTAPAAPASASAAALQRHHAKPDVIPKSISEVS